MPEPRDAPFHGPRIVAVAYLGHLVAVGCTLSIFSVFVKVVAEDFGASMQQAGWGSSLLTLAMGTGSPFVGWLLVRRSARSVMLAGALALGLGLVLVSRATQLWQLALLLSGMVGVGALMVGPLPSATMVANWYVRRRGSMLGIAASGTTSASLALPLLAAFLIEQVGWRSALALIGAGATLVVMPFLWVWAIDRPSRIGQEPDGSRSERAVPAPEPPTTPVSEILRNRNFWLLGAIFGLLFAAGSVMLLFSVPYAIQLGLSLKVGAALLAARSLVGIAGKIALGALTDHMDKRLVLFGTLGMEALFWVLLIRAPNVEVFVAASLAMGFFSGALLPVKGAILGAVFGRPGFSQAMGLMNFSRLPFQILAAPLAGWLYDRSGDYADAFGVFLWGFAAAAVLVTFLRIPQFEPGAEPVVQPAA